MNTDFSALERELRGEDAESEVPDRYSDYEDQYEESHDDDADDDDSADVPSVRFG